MKRVAVFPGREVERHSRLFGALAEVFRVGFEPTDELGQMEADAVVSFGSAIDDVAAPSLSFVSVEHHDTPDAMADVELAATDTLARPLRGASLPDAFGADAPPVFPGPGDEVLASLGRKALWTVSSVTGFPAYKASRAPRELDVGASLRDRLKEQEFIALLPLVHLLDELAGRRWPSPPIRACFVLDDPNLHAKTYGYLDFDALAARAIEDGYHVSIATIPFDHWYVRRSVARTFRSNPQALSVAIHGNDHTVQELAKLRPEPERLATLATALTRMSSLERRWGIGVTRVMVAPHEACSPEMLLDMARFGFSALFYGWGFGASDHPLAGWEPADFVNALPVVPRRPLTSHRGELALRAYLGQPLVLGGHHDDLAQGLDVLTEAAHAVNRLGDVQWLSLGEIAASNLSVRQDGGAQDVRLFSRRARVRVPEGVEHVRVHLPSLHTRPEDERLFAKSSDWVRRAAFSIGGIASVEVGAARDLELSLEHVRRVDIESVRPTRTPGRAVVRRVLTETRDRFKPLADKASRLR